MQRHKGVLEVREFVGVVCSDHGPYQLGGGAGQGQVRLLRNGWPIRVTLPGTLVPGSVQVGEPLTRGLEPADRLGTRGRHVDIEDPGESGFVGQEGQKGTVSGPDYLLVRGVGGYRPGGRYHASEHELPTLTGRGQEALLLVREVSVERGPRYPGPAHDVGHGDGRIAAVGHRGDHGPEQPFPLRGTDRAQRQAITASGQTGLPLVRPGQCAARPGLGHRPTVTGLTLKYSFGLKRTWHPPGAGREGAS